MTAADAQAVRDIVARFAAIQGPVLETLQAVQSALGYVHDDAVRLIAVGLNVTRAEVHGVLTFYPMLRRTPPGRHVIQLCRAEACMAMQGRALERHVLQRLAADASSSTTNNNLTTNKMISLLPVYCLGLCALAPAMMIDGAPVGRVTAERFDELLTELQAMS